MATKAAPKSAPATLPKAALPADLDSLAAVVLTALPSASKAQREDIQTGDHKVDLTLTVRVQGELRVAADHTVQQVNLLPWMEMARLFANRLPQNIVDEVMNEAIAVARQGRESVAAESLKAEADQLKGRVEAAFEQAGVMITAERKGSVRLHGAVSVEVEE